MMHPAEALAQEAAFQVAIPQLKIKLLIIAQVVFVVSQNRHPTLTEMCLLFRITLMTQLFQPFLAPTEAYQMEIA